MNAPGSMNWIKKALDPDNKGTLRRELKAKKGEKIPESKLDEAAEKGGKIGQRARLAKTLRKLKHKHKKH